MSWMSWMCDLSWMLTLTLTGNVRWHHHLLRVFVQSVHTVNSITCARNLYCMGERRMCRNVSSPHVVLLSGVQFFMVNRSHHILGLHLKMFSIPNSTPPCLYKVHFHHFTTRALHPLSLNIIADGHAKRAISNPILSSPFPLPLRYPHHSLSLLYVSDCTSQTPAYL